MILLRGGTQKQGQKRKTKSQTCMESGVLHQSQGLLGRAGRGWVCGTQLKRMSVGGVFCRHLSQEEKIPYLCVSIKFLKVGVGLHNGYAKKSSKPEVPKSPVQNPLTSRQARTEQCSNNKTNKTD